jgi:hypothetical protein
MQDLIVELKSKANLTDEQALLVIQTMKDYIHSKVPPMFSGFVDSFFAGNSTQSEGDILTP